MLPTLPGSAKSRRWKYTLFRTLPFIRSFFFLSFYLFPPRMKPMLPSPGQQQQQQQQDSCTLSSPYSLHAKTVRNLRFRTGRVMKGLDRMVPGYYPHSRGSRGSGIWAGSMDECMCAMSSERGGSRNG